MKLFCDGGKEKGREREGRKKGRQESGGVGGQGGKKGERDERRNVKRKEGRKERQGNTVIIQGSCLCHKTGAVEIHIHIYHQEVTEPHCDYWRLL